MMTLVDASDQITPILKSGLLGTNQELDDADTLSEINLGSIDAKIYKL